MKRIGPIVAVAAISVMALIPANAAPAGQGQVTGNVHLTNQGCIPVATAAKGPTSYQFNGVVITGEFADGANIYNGPIAVTNVNGSSAAENTLGGAGTVNTAAAPASFSGGPTGGKTISGTFYGSFSRNASLVTVALSVTASINGAANKTFPVTVAAHFEPTNGNGVTTPVCDAAFVGAYKV